MNKTTTHDCAAIRLLRSEYRFAKMMARDWGFPDRSQQVVEAAQQHRSEHCK